MNLPFFIARRYLFSKKKHNAINIISGISVCGVALATLALVCTLSVFNGFQDMVAGFFTAFDPELKITVREGKVFDPLESRVQQVRALPEIDVWTETLEENAMVQYKDRQAMAVIKGVEDNFEQLTSIDSLLYGTGKFILNDSVVDYGFMGVELVSELGTGLQFVDPLRSMHLKGMYVSISPIRRRLSTRIICSRRERCLLSTSRNTTHAISSHPWALPGGCSIMTRKSPPSN